MGFRESEIERLRAVYQCVPIHADFKKHVHVLCHVCTYQGARNRPCSTFLSCSQPPKVCRQEDAARPENTHTSHVWICTHKALRCVHTEARRENTHVSHVWTCTHKTLYAYLPWPGHIICMDLRIHVHVDLLQECVHTNMHVIPATSHSICAYPCVYEWWQTSYVHAHYTDIIIGISACCASYTSRWHEPSQVHVCSSRYKCATRHYITHP